MAEVSPLATAEIMKTPLGDPMLVYCSAIASAVHMASAVAENDRISIEDFAGAAAAMALELAAWSLMSAGGSGNFDPAEFGKAAERIAREAMPRFVQDCERKGSTQQ
jgi:hypothetical protein